MQKYSNGRKESSTRICIIGAGPAGMSVLYNFVKLPVVPEIVCFEKQSTWGGLWNYTWMTGTDEYGEPCHGSMYQHLWSNGPKESLEYPDYTFDEHFGRPVPSYLPRAVLRDYLECRFQTAETDLNKFIKFRTVVKNVSYLSETDEFSVTWLNLEQNMTSTEMFSHVIVAVGIFSYPNKPSYPGFESFQGTILHSHDFRCAEAYKDQRLLLIGASYSTEDIALQTIKYGAKSVVYSWRTQPLHFKWPPGIQEKPLLQRVDGKTVRFIDESRTDVDTIILCTGYTYHFPFMDDALRLTSTLSVYPDNLYKGTVYLKAGNNKLFYLGMQDQYVTFPMFDVHALWVSRYIMDMLPDEPKTIDAMRKDVKSWVTRRQNLDGCHDEVNFQYDFVHDLCEATGYTTDVTKSREILHVWAEQKADDISTYRDKCFTSIFTGTRAAPLSTTWFEAMDDCLGEFQKQQRQSLK